MLLRIRRRWARHYRPIFLLLLAVLASNRSADAQPKPKPNYGTVIGIDLGTTYSCEIELPETAEAYLKKTITHAVVTVPAYFNDAQRQATKDAGEIAGLTVLRIINEPTAAAIAFGMDKRNVGGLNVLVFDLGGGTFDVTMLTVDNGVFEVLATNGDTHLGGEDFDERSMAHFIKLCKDKYKKDVRSSNRALQKLRREVEKAKRTLSSEYQTRIEIDALFPGLDLNEPFTRAQFEQLNMDLFKSTLGPVKKVLEDSGLKVGEVHEIVLVGGSTRIPFVQQLLQDFFQGRRPSTGVNPDEAVAFGAAIQASVLSSEDETFDVLLIDVNPLTIGLETKGGVMTSMIVRNTAIPTHKKKEFTTAEDNQNSVNIKVYEGERPLAKDNHLMGSFDLTGITPAPRGEPKIEVKFEIDVNGIIQVTAQDMASNNKKQITITNGHNRLNKQQIGRMIREAEKYAEADRKARERVEMRNSLEEYIYSVRKEIRLLQQATTTSERALNSTISVAVEEAAKWVAGNQGASFDAFDQRLRELRDIADPLLAQMKQEPPTDAGHGGRRQPRFHSDDDDRPPNYEYGEGDDDGRVQDEL